MIGENRDSARPKRWGWHFVLWGSCGLAVIIGGWFLLAVLQLNSQGTALVEFCDESLLGMLSEEIQQSAEDAEFEFVQRQDLLVLTMPGKQKGRTCFVDIRNGRASEVNTAYTF